MDADELREALATLPRELLDRPVGTVAITLDSVVGAGLDPGAVDAWVAERGGQVRDRVTNRPASVGGPSGRRAETRVTSYFVVPLDALDA